MPQVISDYGSYNLPTSDSMFLRLEIGENQIRLCSDPTEIKFHVISPKGAKYETKPCTGEDCELCKQGKPSKYKYAYVVLNRKTGKVQIFEAGMTIFQQILGLATDVDYGNPQMYDLKIKKEGERLETVYTVIPSPKKKPLTDEENALVATSEITMESYLAGKQ